MQHDRPRVSVIVPTFNRSRFIVDCLESLLAQTLPPAELIVVDDQSSDATRSVLATYGDRIVHLETPSQLGKPGAVNLGLEHATGEYIWVFDDDDVALPDALARFTDALERHPECGFSWSPWFVADTMPDGSLGPATFETREPDIATIGFLPALLERNFLGGGGALRAQAVLRRVRRLRHGAGALAGLRRGDPVRAPLCGRARGWRRHLHLPAARGGARQQQRPIRRLGALRQVAAVRPAHPPPTAP
jgi:glycosyltransferase involved in cell wall biosynthesis